MLDSRPESPERAQQELLLQLTLGRALTTTLGYGSTEAERAFERARDLSEQVGDDRQRFQSLQGVWSIHMSRADLDKAAELGQEQLRMAERARDPAQRLSAHWAAGATALFRGEYSEARAHTEEVIGRYDPQEYRTQDSFHTGSEDPWVIARSHLAAALFSLGYPDQALTTGWEALALARELSHPASEAWALGFFSGLQRNRREAEAALQTAETLIALANEHGLAQLAGLGAYLRAAAMADRGQTQEVAGLLAAR